MPLDPDARAEVAAAARAEISSAVAELRDELAALRAGADDRAEALDRRADRILEALREGRIDGGSETLIAALAAAARVSSGELLEFLRWGIAERAKWGSRRR